MNEESKRKLAATRHAWYIKNKKKHHELVKSWRAKNKSRSIELGRALYARNIEKRRAQARVLRALNPEKYRKACSDWAKAHPEKMRALNAKKHADRRRACVAWANQKEIDKIYEKAYEVTKQTGKRWEVDHIVPIVSPIVCGLHVEHNLQLMIKEENISKFNRYWPDMP